MVFTIADLDAAHKAMQEALIILDAIKGGTPSDRVFYEMGRALGTLHCGLVASGYAQPIKRIG